MPLDTNTVAPTLLDAVMGLDCPLPDSTPTQRGALADRLEASAETIMYYLSWAYVSRTGEDHFGDAASKVRRALRGAARELRDYTPPVPAPAPAPVYEWGQRVMAMRHGRPVEAFFVSGPDGDGRLKVVFRGVAYAVCVRAKDVSPITPAAVPEPVAPPSPRRPQVGDLVRFVEPCGGRAAGVVGTITRIRPARRQGLMALYVVSSEPYAEDAECFASRFEVIRPVEWTPKVGDKVKVVGRSYLGFEAGDVVGAVDHVEASVSHAILLRFPGECGRKNYKPEQVYPASL